MKKYGVIIGIIGLILIGFLISTKNNETVTTDAEKSNEATTVQAEEKVIKVGMSGGYKPYTYIDENSELTGFDVDVWKEIGSRIGYEIEFQTADFSGLFGLLDSDKINTIANQITVTDERTQKYDFTDPYVHYGAQLVVKGDNNDINSLESLKGKRVGVSLGSNYEKMIKDYDVNSEIEVVTYESFQGSLQDVSIGRIDAVLNDKLASLIAIEESGLDIKFGGEPVERLQNAFPFIKNDENKSLIADINLAIEDMYNDGTMKEISLKYFPVDITVE